MDTSSRRSSNDQETKKSNHAISVAEFVERVNATVGKHFKCCICFSILEDPVMLPCNHSLCRACAIQSLRQYQRCPQCLASIPNMRALQGRNKWIAGMVDSLRNCLNEVGASLTQHAPVPSKYQNARPPKPGARARARAADYSRIRPPSPPAAVCCGGGGSASGGGAKGKGARNGASRKRPRPAGPPDSPDAMADRPPPPRGSRASTAYPVHATHSAAPRSQSRVSGDNLSLERNDKPKPVQDGEDCGNTAPATPPRPFVLGDLVFVEHRTWPGMNKHGGVALVCAVLDPPGSRYDVKYSVSQKLDRGVEAHFIHPYSFPLENVGNRSRRGGARRTGTKGITSGGGSGSSGSSSGSRASKRGRTAISAPASVASVPSATTPAPSPAPSQQRTAGSHEQPSILTDPTTAIATSDAMRNQVELEEGAESRYPGGLKKSEEPGTVMRRVEDSDAEVLDAGNKGSSSAAVHARDTRGVVERSHEQAKEETGENSRPGEGVNFTGENVEAVEEEDEEEQEQEQEGEKVKEREKEDEEEQGERADMGDKKGKGKGKRKLKWRRKPSETAAPSLSSSAKGDEIKEGQVPVQGVSGTESLSMSQISSCSGMEGNGTQGTRVGVRRKRRRQRVCEPLSPCGSEELAAEHATEEQFTQSEPGGLEIGGASDVDVEDVSGFSSPQRRADEEGGGDVEAIGLGVSASPDGTDSREDVPRGASTGGGAAGIPTVQPQSQPIVSTTDAGSGGSSARPQESPSYLAMSHASLVRPESKPRSQGSSREAMPPPPPPAPLPSPAQTRQTVSSTSEPLSLSSPAASLYKVGDLVEVPSRSSPGVNKEGGVAKVTRVSPDGTYCVKYLVRQGTEKGVAGALMSPYSLGDDSGDRSGDGDGDGDDEPAVGGRVGSGGGGRSARHGGKRSGALPIPTRRTHRTNKGYCPPDAAAGQANAACLSYLLGETQHPELDLDPDLGEDLDPDAGGPVQLQTRREVAAVISIRGKSDHAAGTISGNNDIAKGDTSVGGGKRLDGHISASSVKKGAVQNTKGAQRGEIERVAVRVAAGRPREADYHGSDMFDDARRDTDTSSPPITSAAPQDLCGGDSGGSEIVIGDGGVPTGKQENPPQVTAEGGDRPAGALAVDTLDKRGGSLPGRRGAPAKSGSSRARGSANKKSVAGLTRRGRAQAVVLTLSSLTPDMSSLARSIARSRGWIVEGKYTSEVTHVICGRMPGSNVASIRSSKFLRAVASGKWVVSEAWLQECQRRGTHAEEQPFELAGDRKSTIPSAPRRSRLAHAELDRPGLFQGASFYFRGEFGTRAPPLSELKAMLLANGGTMVETMRSLLASGRAQNGNEVDNASDSGTISGNAGSTSSWRPQRIVIFHPSAASPQEDARVLARELNAFDKASFPQSSQSGGGGGGVGRVADRGAVEVLKPLWLVDSIGCFRALKPTVLHRVDLPES